MTQAQHGELPSWAIVADASGRVTGEDHIRRLTGAVAEDGGSVLDDYHDLVWPAADIASGQVTYGWPGITRTWP